MTKKITATRKNSTISLLFDPELCDMTAQLKRNDPDCDAEVVDFFTIDQNTLNLFAKSEDCNCFTLTLTSECHKFIACFSHTDGNWNISVEAACDGIWSNEWVCFSNTLEPEVIRDFVSSIISVAKGKN